MFALCASSLCSLLHTTSEASECLCRLWPHPTMVHCTQGSELWITHLGWPVRKEFRLTHHKRQAHRTDRHSRHPGRTSRKWGYSAHWHTSTDWVGTYELKGTTWSQQELRRRWTWLRPIPVHLATWTGGVGFILIVATVIVAVTQPAQGDAAVVLALEPIGGASVLVWIRGGEKWIAEICKWVCNKSAVVYFAILFHLEELTRAGRSTLTWINVIIWR